MINEEEYFVRCRQAILDGIKKAGTIDGSLVMGESEIFVTVNALVYTAGQLLGLTIGKFANLDVIIPDVVVPSLMIGIKDGMRHPVSVKTISEGNDSVN